MAAGLQRRAPLPEVIWTAAGKIAVSPSDGRRISAEYTPTSAACRLKVANKEACDSTSVSVATSRRPDGATGVVVLITARIGRALRGPQPSSLAAVHQEVGALIQTLPLYGGEDERGTGFASTTMLISTSAA